MTHGVVEAQAEDLDEEVDGVARHVLLRPAPVEVFEDETWEGGQNEIARLLFDELEAAFLEQWQERRLAGGADLLAGPFRRGVGHSRKGGKGVSEGRKRGRTNTNYN